MFKKLPYLQYDKIVQLPTQLTPQDLTLFTNWPFCSTSDCFICWEDVVLSKTEKRYSTFPFHSIRWNLLRCVDWNISPQIHILRGMPEIFWLDFIQVPQQYDAEDALDDWGSKSPTTCCHPQEIMLRWLPSPVRVRAWTLSKCSRSVNRLSFHMKGNVGAFWEARHMKGM